MDTEHHKGSMLTSSPTFSLQKKKINLISSVPDIDIFCIFTTILG